MILVFIRYNTVFCHLCTVSVFLCDLLCLGPIVGFGQVSCLEEAKMEKMKDEVQISFSSWLDVFHKTQNGASEKDFLATPNILVADRQNQPQPTSNQPLPHTNHPQPSCTYCQG